MTEHAKLSASGAHRWMSCPGSVKAEENIANQTNAYAEEGSLAHEIASATLNNRFFGKDNFKYCVSDEMKFAIDQYIGYVSNILESELLNYNESEMEEFKDTLYVEHKVDFSHIVPDGFGTADCIIKTQNYIECGNSLHIIDFKYGVSPINAYNNMQLLLYALGALNLSGNDPEVIYMHIVQPRINNYSVWKLSYFELVSWVKYINSKALDALKEDAPRIPSEEACRWCKARFSCYALRNVTNDVINLHNKKDLTNSEIKYVLDNSNLVKSFISSLEKKVYELIESGNNFDGYKIIEGRTIRKLKDNIDEKLLALLGEKAYSKSIINVTELDKLLTKDEVDSLVYLSKSKPRLVKEENKGNSIILDSLISEIID